MRRGSRKEGKQEPLRSFKIASSMRPARVSRRERRSRPLAAAIPVVEAVRAVHARRGAGPRLGLQLHHPLGGESQQLADEIAVRCERLFLPGAGAADPARLDGAGVPAEHRAACSKPETAPAELDRVVAAGVRVGPVLADAG